MVTPALVPGVVAWAELGPGVGREQSGRRPVVVVSTKLHLRAVDSLVTVVACTSRDRDWDNHIALSGPTGLAQPTFAMTEQVRTISRERIFTASGYVDAPCLNVITEWVKDWIE